MEGAADDEEGDMRGFSLQFFELLEKGAVEVEFLAVVEGVPLVTPPDFGIVDGERMIGVVLGDDGFFAEAARAFVEVAGVAFTQAAGEAATRAGFGFGHGEFCVELLVFRGDFEGALAFLAGLVHGLGLVHDSEMAYDF